MARNGDVGPYSAANVTIILARQNSRDALLGKKLGPRPQEVRRKIAKTLRGVKHTLERRLNQSLAHMGQRPDPEMLKRRNASIKRAWARRKRNGL